jgi:hypothetical protein
MAEEKQRESDAIHAAREALEHARTMSLDAAGCYAEGYERGYGDGRDGYEGALDASIPCDGYGWQSSYRQGYIAGWENGDSHRPAENAE